MRDPLRLTEDGAGATAREREVLRAGREAGPGPRLRDELWAAIAAQGAVPVPPAGGATATGGALVAAKVTLLALALGGGAVTGLRVWQHRAPVAVAPVAERPAPSIVAAPVVAPAPVSAGVVPAPRLASRAPRAPLNHETAPRALASRAAAPVAETAASRLAGEGQAVLDARAALRAGDAAGALRLLEAARRAFGAGGMEQEREALAIEALGRAGQTDAARDRAQAFLRAYPHSPHAANVARFASR